MVTPLLVSGEVAFQPPLTSSSWNIKWRLRSLSYCNHLTCRDGDYVFPMWANAIGWCVAVSSLLALLPSVILEVTRVWRQGLPWSRLLEPDLEWKMTSAARLVVPEMTGSTGTSRKR